VDSGGNVYVAGGNSTIVKITQAGVASLFAGRPWEGMVYGGDLFGPPPGPPTTNGLPYASEYADGWGGVALFDWPAGLAVDGAGNVYVADYGNSALRKITPAGYVTTLYGGPNAATPFPCSALALDGAGNLFVVSSSFIEISATGARTTLPAMPMGTGLPGAVAVDSAGNLYAAQNNAIFKGSPVWVSQQSGSVTVASGHSAVFSVAPGGASSPTYQWFFNSSPIPGASHAVDCWPHHPRQDFAEPHALVAGDGRSCFRSQQFGNRGRFLSSVF
jgi:hypothetical protein